MTVISREVICTIPPLSDIMQNEWAAAGENYETFWQPTGRCIFDTVTYGAGLVCKMGGNLLAFRGQIGQYLTEGARPRWCGTADRIVDIVLDIVNI